MNASISQKVLPTHWDDFDSFLDPQSYDRIWKANWPSIKTDGADQAIEKEISQSRTRNTARQQDAVSEISGKLSDDVLRREEPKATTAKGKQVKPKARGAIKTQDLERRRGQIRLAQQNYRRRKEATINSLQDEVCRLRGVQAKMQQLFEQLHWQALSLSAICQNSEIAHQVECTAAGFMALAGDYGTTTCYEQKASMPLSKLSPTIDISPKETLSSLVEIRPKQDFPSAFHSHTGPTIAIPALDPIHSGNQYLNPEHALRPLVAQPSIGEFDPTVETSLPLAIRLRHEALKRGLDHITNLASPHSLLVQIFQFCMYTMTRGEIAMLIKYRLQQSAEAAFYQLTTGFKEQSWASPINTSWDPRQSLLGLNKTRTFPTNQAHNSQADEEYADYLDPEGVQQYLSKKGLWIDLGSPSVSLQNPNSFLGKESTTLSQELAGSGEIWLDTRMILTVLLDCCVCLNSGPGFCIAEINRDIGTLVKSVLLEMGGC